MAIAELPPLVALALLTMLILILVAYKATIGAVVDWLIRAIPDIRTPSVFGHSVSVFGWITGPLGAFQNLVYHTLGTLIAADHAVWNKFVSWNAYAWGEVSGAIADVGHGAEHALTRLRHATIPALIGAATGPLGLLVYGLRSQLAALVKTVAHDGHRAAVTITHVVNPTVTKVEHVTRVVYRDVPAAISQAVDHPLALIHGIDETLKDTLARVNKIARQLTPAGVAGLVAAAMFGGFGLGWLRCKGVNRVGRHLCSLSGLIETIASDAIEALAVADLCQLMNAMSYATKQFEPALIAFVDVENALIGCRGFDAPPDLSIPRLSLPPAPASLTV